MLPLFELSGSLKKMKTFLRLKFHIFIQILYTYLSIKIPMYKNQRKESISLQIQLDTFMAMQFMVVSLHQ